VPLFVLKKTKERKKERFFEAYEKGARSTKEALHEYERSTYEANV